MSKQHKPDAQIVDNPDQAFAMARNSDYYHTLALEKKKEMAEKGFMGRLALKGDIREAKARAQTVETEVAQNYKLFERARESKQVRAFLENVLERANEGDDMKVARAIGEFSELPVSRLMHNYVFADYSTDPEDVAVKAIYGLALTSVKPERKTKLRQAAVIPRKDLLDAYKTTVRLLGEEPAISELPTDFSAAIDNLSSVKQTVLVEDLGLKVNFGMYAYHGGMDTDIAPIDAMTSF